MDIGAFFNEVETIEKNIDTIHENIKRIQNLQSRILVATQTSEVDNVSNERDQLMNVNRQLLIQSKDRIKQIERENVKIPYDPNYELRVQRHKFLREKLSNIIKEYRGVEDAYLKQQTVRTARQYKIVNPSATQQEIDDYISSPSGQPLFQQALLHSEARDALDQVKKRHNDIKHIEETVAELLALFNELYLQVEKDDETIVKIEENATDTAVKLGQATVALDQAHTSAAAARKKKWICLLIVVIVLVIIAIVLAFVLNPKNTK